jgi:hypothetical protein
MCTMSSYPATGFSYGHASSRKDTHNDYQE